MARVAVFASGRGSNFVAIAESLTTRREHSLEFLLTDRPRAAVLDRARERGITSYIVPYKGRERTEAEAEILTCLSRHAVELIALAGFMRLFTPFFLRGFKGDIINIHPALLPKYPGTHGIGESYRSPDKELGISIIRIDEGCDTGPVILQKSFQRNGSESLEEIEAKIHELEHLWYPRVLMGLLDDIEERRKG
jgi:phosphoribosylglycinamide formyltransferase-1